MLERFKRAYAKYRDSDPQDRRLTVNAHGVRLWNSRSGRTLWRVRWDALEEVVAYKADAVVVDHLCLGFHETGSEVHHVTDEETPGWDELNAALASRFGVELSKWFGDVAFPAFATNWTTLWRRPSRGLLISC